MDSGSHWEALEKDLCGADSPAEQKAGETLPTDMGASKFYFFFRISSKCLLGQDSYFFIVLKGVREEQRKNK